VIQSILVTISFIILFFVPSIYFSSTLSLRKDSINENQINSNPQHKDDEVSVYKETNYLDLRFYSVDGDTGFPGAGSPKKYKRKSECSIFWKNLCTILSHMTYLFCALGLASLFFVITAVQYWGSDYMENVLGVKDKQYRMLSFSVVCITSPTLGVILGGWVISRIGGYESKHSILVCFIFAIFAGAFSIPVPVVDDLFSFTGYLWLVLFFGGAIVPPMTGILISTLPKHLRGPANSITCLISNSLGYLPAPYVYGVINNYYGKDSPRTAFMTIMYYSFTGVVFIIIAMYFRYRFFNKLNQNKNLQMTSNLIQERKLSSSTRGSIISTSNNIAKIFGSYLNVDENRNEIVEENLQEDDIEKNSNDTEINKLNLETNCKNANSSDEDEENINTAIHKKNQSPAKSMQTPQFTILKNSHDFEYLSKFNHKDNEQFSKEESLFAPRVEYSTQSNNKESSDELSNLNIDKISKSLNDELVENLDKEFVIKTKSKKGSFDSSGTGMNIKSV
jgi:hypothetical protein